MALCDAITLKAYFVMYVSIRIEFVMLICFSRPMIFASR
ncbi:hypothetical protein FRUB_09590 [Fimbriiglobus ruber]|uniref:Uncharacterized protein n=1 Tax=Fimbriiglobus ruber TaxID=1908690 RepID=A0A225D874_9BACT|nr:hypothetical protein FRUB_09590 [Fimbriiglobus ruber]